MSIDAMIVGVRIGPDDVSLVLEPRDSKNGPSGQSILTVDNPPSPPGQLGYLIGECVWGNASVLMLGKTKIADRVSYTRIRLVEPAKK